MKKTLEQRQHEAEAMLSAKLTPREARRLERYLTARVQRSVDEAMARVTEEFTQRVRARLLQP